MAITISGSGIVEANIADGAVSSDKLATGIDATKLADGTVTSTELQYINTLASNAQTQISAASTVTPVMKLLHTTYAFSGAPGTQVLSGVGFAPDAIFGMWGVGNDTFKTPNIFWAINSASSLAQSGTRDFNAWRHNEKSTASTWMWANAGMQWIDSHSDYIQGTVTTWGSDGITMTYTATGSPGTSQTMNQATAYFKLT